MSRPGGATPRRRAFAVIAVLLLAAAAGAWSAVSGWELAQARDRHAAAAAHLAQVMQNVAEARGDHRAAMQRAQRLLASADAALDEEATAYFGSSVRGDVAEAADLVRGSASREVPELPRRPELAPPASTAEYERAVQRLDGLAGEAAAALSERASVTAQLEAAADSLTDALSLFAQDATLRAQELEEAHIAAAAPTRIELQDAAWQVATGEAERLAETVPGYVAAARAVEESGAAELAEKEGPLRESRLAAEDFARSLAGQVRLDFDWAPLVSGLGGGLSAGGHTTWWYQDGGYATISLSDSVAANWPGSLYVSLVAHEVGHAVTSRCAALVEESFGGDHELFATSWAISQGFTDPAGNGVSFYGIDPDPEQVAAAAGC